MGSQSVKAITNQSQRKNFTKHLLNDIEALDEMIKTDAFEKGIQRVGAEQELCIVDRFFRPSFNALKILDQINDTHFTTELGLFNIEANLDPLKLEGKCFSQLENDLYELIAKAQKAAELVDKNKIILTGILPTFKRSDLVFKNMTPYQRYQTLNDVIKKVKGNDFRLKIRGIDELILDHESILFEACNTSFQVHLQVDLNEVIDKYNWSQAIAGPVLSLMTNSPMLLGKELWSETRIALFQQSVDIRNTSHLLREQKPRVSFGTDWVKSSILELFTDDITRYAALVTSDFDSESLEELQNGIKPELKALNLHNGTLYKWNRLCYGVAKNIAHLRIENRYIPSGPSIKDEIANAAFWIGVMQGMPEEYKNIWEKMAFKDARGNFIKAARTGMDTYFNWFGQGISAKELGINILLPMAEEGLKKSHIEKSDIDYYLGVIRKRIEKNISGSKWHVRSSRKLKEFMSADEANILLTYSLHKYQAEDIPVYQWELAKPFDKGFTHSQNQVYKVMTTEVFVVNQNDLVALIEKIMIWKNIHHLPIVNDSNAIVGIISSTTIAEADTTINDLTARDIMKKQIKTGYPEMPLDDAIMLMEKEKIGCLPILDNHVLVGILTNEDLKNIDNN
ncbi:MAG: CBS domain-containing protein [Winogradskyella sp.]|uniref:CBS domain-containing protein n=1 Tax=Winogradskyella sp. TaxID=1883156 RepID=UPI0017F48E69|nr:CBS domain-containing protein [Winogradskyella sp.]